MPIGRRMATCVKRPVTARKVVDVMVTLTYTRQVGVRYRYRAMSQLKIGK
jgi:hypothetical protein